MDRIFKALADPSRRLLLDLLRERDGRTLVELAAALPGMTRFGVSSHLQVLAAAGLISTAKVGREKHHFLNAVPLQEIQNRWLTPFTSQQAQRLLDFRTRLEQEPTMSIDAPTTRRTADPDASSGGPDTVFVIYIRAGIERVWAALTDSSEPRPWLYDSIARSDWAPGSDYTMDSGDVTLIRGTVLVSEAPHRLVLSFDPQWDDQVAAEAAGELEYRLANEEPDGAVVRLTVSLTGMSGESALSAARDTPAIYSALKTLLETGRPMR